MRLSLIAALALALLPCAAAAESCVMTCFGTAPAPAPGEEIAPSEPQPLTAHPGWSVAAYGGAGAVLMNTAGGQHLFTPEVSLSSAVRMSDLATMRTVLDFSRRRDGAPSSDVWVDNTYTVFAPRLDLTYGTPRAQFVVGAGPAVVFSTTRLHGPGRNVHATGFAPGFVYGTGLRWTLKKTPMAIDFGGQQRSLRHDFRMTFSIGFPVSGGPRPDAPVEREASKR